MTNDKAPRGATGAVRPQHERTKALATGIARAPMGNRPSTRRQSTPAGEKSPRPLAPCTMPVPTRPITWLEAHPVLGEVAENCRAMAIDLHCPELALAALVFGESQCGGMPADPGTEGEGDTMALYALEAIEGLGRILTARAMEARLSCRVEAHDTDASMQRKGSQRSIALMAINHARALVVDLVDLHDVLTGAEPMQGAK